MDSKTYHGGCHCGAVKYKAKLDLSKVYNCNCSICSKRGLLVTFAPADAFTLLQGEDALQDYFFNKKVVNHRFCKTCGVESFAEGKMPDGSPARAVNARCLEDVDVSTLQLTPIDGKSF